MANGLTSFMKNCGLMTFAFLAICTTQARGINFKFGVNASCFQDTQSSPLLGWTVGIGREVPLTDNAAFSWDLLYNIQGSILKNIIIFEDDYYQSRPNYLGNIRMQIDNLNWYFSLKFFPPILAKIKPSVFMGPSILWYSFSQKIEKSNLRPVPEGWRSKGYKPIEIAHYGSKSRIKHPYKIGYILGIGCGLKQLSVELRYSFMFQNIDYLSDVDLFADKIQAMHLIIVF